MALLIGTNSWRDQFVEAITVSSGKPLRTCCHVLPLSLYFKNNLYTVPCRLDLTDLTVRMLENKVILLLHLWKACPNRCSMTALTLQHIFNKRTIPFKMRWSWMPVCSQREKHGSVLSIKITLQSVNHSGVWERRYNHNLLSHPGQTALSIKLELPRTSLASYFFNLVTNNVKLLSVFIIF